MTTASVIHLCREPHFDAATFCHAVRRLLKTCTPGTTVVVDLQLVTSMDTAGLVAIYTALQAADVAGRPMKLQGVNAQLEENLFHSQLRNAATFLSAFRVKGPDRHV